MNQEQITSTPTPLVSSQPSSQKIINTIAIIALIYSSLIGLILMWLLANWSKKTKIIITVILSLIIIIPFLIMIRMEGAEGIEEIGRLIILTIFREGIFRIMPPF